MPSATSPSAVAEIERVGVGDRVAVAVDHREMRGVVAFGGDGVAGADARARPRALRIDRLAQLRGVALRGQPRRPAPSPRRDRREIRRGPHRRASSPRSSDAALRRSRHRCRAGEIAFEDVEHLDQVHAAGGGRRHRDDVVAAIVAAHRRAARSRGKFARSSAVMTPPRCLHGGDDLLGDRPLVEGARSVRARSPRATRRDRSAPAGRRGRARRRRVCRKIFARRGPAREPRLRARQRIGEIVLDRRCPRAQARSRARSVAPA